MGQVAQLFFVLLLLLKQVLLFQAASPPSPLPVALTSLWPEVDKPARLTIKSEVKKQIGRRSPLYDHSCLHNAHSVLLLRLPSDSFRFIDSLYWTTSIQNRFNKNKKKIYFFASLFTSFHTRVPINFSRSRSLIVSLLKFSQQNVPLAGAISKWDKKPRIRSCSFQSYSSCFVVLSIDKCQTSFVAGACCVTCQSIRRSISMFGPTEP